ncbi:hypothetical protein S1OALGB6SA_2312 [Olavius algarvensis spirochete endosymbiont]|uniref:histidinol-phosphate transaminase n=1 Tax=Olavius algarvensis spirochete endosymbiont TaxID=260710 RepID=UPI00052CF26F|nr:histidinol-phosphate transaminase [Olavius algarvensis spirochete endosymbiont]KGM38289.1 hypothetical protein JY97_17195 [Alkalispirochaeta odontotermitis]VDB01211.1 hypothetical protein S1OALGB6SA_2312 [Olavius algarvensis spirochete endosymbiont]
MRINPNISSMETYVPGRTIKGAIKLSSNENPLGPSPLALAAIKDSLSEIHSYPDGACVELRSKLGELWKLDADNILVANGSDELLVLLAAALINSSCNAVGARQTFSQYRYAVRLFGGEMREKPLISGFYDFSGMLDLINSNTRLIFLCNPNNPTGTYRNSRELEAFLRKIPAGIVVALDEAYADFADANDFPDSRRLLVEFPNLLILRTFSKIYGLAGLRVGYAVARQELISGLAKASMPFNVNSLAQVAAHAALADTEHRESTLKLVHTEKRFLEAELNKRGIFNFPTQANFICFGLEWEISEIWEWIARKGIALRGLQSFGLPKMARYTLGSRVNNQTLIKILDELSTR